ncbi:type III secretion system export apparatus subunit SctU [Erwinia tracheiphila]|uniref:EscU/YscU/HrcU family type III secretion system export apparatus switch protein n=1 Tax=Erwinia tracheiphila TaxID=65700 RepID=A0A345CUV3_9GAMM|nr:type III secretion system export apparatus subunit SctU [Erwinia tracheiphila]AXF77220.1 EscU/YscU/HrcU family type III secretion system export apparatus switch protein [Erwinia tracheiphila]UIA84087.1 type III secretion system export apparatus subunit SctU [Erwinia tracheiphila]UIA92669.1 type III secretion system export apparatus subunit SctU [Erwinia tracheiphila]
MAEKTEKPTKQKLQDARRKGQVSQSQEVPKLFICAGIVEMVLTLDDVGMQKLQALMMLPLARISQPFELAANEVVGSALTLVATFCGVTVSLAALLRIIGGWIQYGPLFAPEALKPDFNRLDPINQFKQMFSVKKLTDMLNSILKAAAICTIFYLVMTPDLESLARLSYGDLDSFWPAVEVILTRVSRQTLLTLLVLTMLDFGLQKYFFIKQQRMSHQDIRDEHKQSEGNPHMKGHRKALAHELLNEPVKAVKSKPVEEADLLLVNPTHYAVALYYRPELTPLPRIICKGEDKEAKELITRAQKANIPVIRFIWLARTLYRSQEGQMIPRHTLQAVAQVYRVLRELDDQILDEVIELEAE